MPREHIPVDTILDSAKEQDLTEVLVAGWDSDGQLYGACSTGRMEDILELLDMLKCKLVRGDYRE